LKVAAVLIMLFLYLGGCVYVPYRTQLHRQSLEESIKAIKEGVTTKEQVLLTFGEPDWVSVDEQKFFYYCFEVHGLLMVVTPDSGGGGEIKAEHNLTIEFDENNIVKKIKLKKGKLK